VYSQTFQALVDQAEQLRQELAIPGAAIGVLADGQIEAAGLGVASLPNPLPVTPETLFQVGSITKTFVGTAAMRLVEAGALDLDAPLRGSIPGLRLRDPEAQERATMRHLLTHTGGWRGDYFDDLGWGDDALRRMVEERMPGLPQVTPLGATFSYNNAGFYLAGRAIELLCGKPFEAAMTELVLGPLGLEQSHFFPHEVMLGRFATGHQQGADGAVRQVGPWPIGRAAHPAGGIVSSVGDLLAYARLHLGLADGLLSTESVAQMQIPHTSSVSILDSIALTWFTYDAGGARFVNHGGATKGQVAALWLCPARGFALAALTNADQGGRLTRAVFRAAAERYLGVIDRDPDPVEAPRERLEPLAGRYGGDLSDVEIALDEGGLSLQLWPKGGFPTPDSPPGPTPPPAPLRLYGEHMAFVPEGPQQSARAEFGGWADGRPGWIRYGGRVRLRSDG